MVIFNYFLIKQRNTLRSILIGFLIMVSIGMLVTSVAYADILPPNKQKKLGITNENIICDSGKFKVLKATDDKVACITPSNVYKLIANGWAKPVDDKKLDPFIALEEKSVGTVNTLSVTPVKPLSGTIKEKSTIISYDYIFEVCVTEKIFNPTILITSDSDSKHFELAHSISPDKCSLSVSRIKAASPDTIQSTLLNKGEISKTIIALESKIESLKADLSEARSLLGKGQGQENAKQGNTIADLRKQINDARAELHRLYFTMYASSSKITPLAKSSFSGNPIEGETATKLSVAKSLGGENQHVVTFETCAGEKQIRLPVVAVSSDKQTLNVKIGTKISPNSCQLTTAKIMADDPETISVKPVGNDDVNKVGDLETKISDLQEKLIIEKNLLRDLIHNSDRPDNFNEQANLLSQKIIDLRKELISTKAELSKIMLETLR